MVHTMMETIQNQLSHDEDNLATLWHEIQTAQVSTISLRKALKRCVKMCYQIMNSSVLTICVRHTKVHKGARLKESIKEAWMLQVKISAVCYQSVLA